MAYKRSFGKPELVSLPPCVHLRSKTIYVTGNPDPDDDAEHICWCNKTQHATGPDSSMVDRCSCVEGRECYEPRS